MYLLVFTVKVRVLVDVSIDATSEISHIRIMFKILNLMTQSGDSAMDRSPFLLQIRLSSFGIDKGANERE